MLQGQRQALGDSNLSSMAVSLCVVWYVAVILLGAATALLATSSTILDSIMDLRLKALVHQNEDEKSESKDARNAAVDTTTRIQFPMAQKLTLVLLILVLFYSQMWFFEWIHSALNSLSPSGVAVSTRLSVFGLLSSTLMITLGVRIIPVVTDAPDLQ
ncbi:hypothetical protein FBU30_010658 [Linnemannia zychae]|nr:hypothetical protein FBU30_010658 [Linnemannia zychae]